jgi:hypothetical protein
VEQSQSNFTLNNVSRRKFSSQKLIQFSLRNNVLDDPASSTDDFRSIDTDISSTMLNRPIWNNENLSPERKSEDAGSIIFTNSLNSHRESSARCSSFGPRWYPFERYMCSINSYQ